MNAAEFLVVTVTSWLTPTVLFCVLNLTIVTIVITSSLNKLGHHQDNSRPQLVRVPSLLERVKSINLSLYRTQNLEPLDSESAAHYTSPPQEPTDYQKSEAKVDDMNHSESVEDIHVTRSSSETCMKAPAKRVLKKSASEKVFVAETEVEADLRRPVTVRETTYSNGPDDEAVDAKADDFINRFRQQLKLQRLDSILRYREMINRGLQR
ncbi:uncharacterized protein LOC111377593 [Olea europaea var. sylvestris]|uniref:uncharacterized protein LOC111377593 n=1 Tax=Olea europaea var. sylvestris TaxID=158386 RepID=UPI000C1CF473|nr:uncharacterized protein LOC111377593 [Olea europaea var. sylvestris]